MQLKDSIGVEVVSWSVVNGNQDVLRLGYNLDGIISWP